MSEAYGSPVPGSACPSWSRTARITSTAVVGWNDEETHAAFADHGPVRVEADIRTAALAEARLGNGSDSSVFLYLNLGTGISHCLVIMTPQSFWAPGAIVIAPARIHAPDTEVEDCQE